MKKNNKVEEKKEPIIYLDLEAIDNFINYSDNNLTNDAEVLDTYDAVDENGTLALTSRTISNKKISSNPQIDNIRYDLVKMLITTVFESSLIDDPVNAKTGAIIAFNTLKKKKMLKIK